MQLKQLREHLPMTQTELAEEVGVSVQAVRAWEAGKSIPRPSHLRRLAQILEMPARELTRLFVREEYPAA